MTRKSALRDECDILFSQLVRRAGQCRRCRATRDLQCAHIESRKFTATRCDPQNAFCLCAECHHMFTAYPRKFEAFVYQELGDEAVAELRRRAQKITPNTIDWWAAEKRKLERMLR